MNIIQFSAGDFFRYKCGKYVLTMRREKDCFIVLEPISFKAYRLNYAQARIIKLITEGVSISEIRNTVGMKQSTQINMFINKCMKYHILPEVDV